jgi:hypothetical protein
MRPLKPNRQRLSLRGLYQGWKADMTLRHRWFRVLLHLQGMARCPRNVPWHWGHITGEFYVRKPRG